MGKRGGNGDGAQVTAFPTFCAARPAERRHDRDVRSVSAASSRAEAEADLGGAFPEPTAGGRSSAMDNCTNDTISPGAERKALGLYLDRNPIQAM
jgi:hypothetical protein